MTMTDSPDTPVSEEVPTPSFIEKMLAGAEPPNVDDEYVARLMEQAKDTPVSYVPIRKKDGKDIFPVSCPECGGTLLWPSLRQHLRSQHGRELTQKLSREYYDNLRFYGEFNTWARTGPKVKTTVRQKNGNQLFPVSCPECSSVMLWSSLRQHLREKHGTVVEGKLTQAYYESIRFNGKFNKKRKPNSKVAPKAVVDRPQPLDPEAVSQRVLRVLFPEGIPVTKLKLVNAWVEATEQFVKDAGL